MSIYEKPVFRTHEQFPATIAADRVLSHLWLNIEMFGNEYGSPMLANALRAVVHEHAPTMISLPSDADDPATGMRAGEPWCSSCSTDHGDYLSWSDCRTITTLAVMLGVPLPLSFTHYGDIIKATR